MTAKISKQEKKKLTKLLKEFQVTKSGRDSVRIAKEFEKQVSDIKSKS